MLSTGQLLLRTEADRVSSRWSEFWRIFHRINGYLNKQSRIMTLIPGGLYISGQAA
jgi:hypothetical protein